MLAHPLVHRLSLTLRLAGWDRPKGSERPRWYKHSDLHLAWSLLLDASEQCTPSKAFFFDLVDVGREWLSIAPCNDAYDALISANTSAEVSTANASMAAVMSDLDRLLATSDGFLLGQWVADARKLASSDGADPKDADFLEWNARSQVTSWFPVDGKAGHGDETCTEAATKLDGLWDYGNKAWSGLVDGYYNKRYFLYAQHKIDALLRRAPSTDVGDGSTAAFEFTDEEASSYIGDVMKAACLFGHRNSKSQPLPATSTGDTVAIARELLAKYPPTSGASA
eukprot:COSAG02_NODE_1535_length_12053_cov_13.122794_6_plen_281_part_00